MTEEMKKKRDELAKDYGTNRFPVQNIETRKDFTQDINFARRMTQTEAFQAGFDACYKLMEADLRKVVKDALFIIEGSTATEGQSDNLLRLREDALMSLLSYHYKRLKENKK